MNILVLSLRGPTNSNLKGGSREVLTYLAKGWIKEGHSVRVICGTEKDLENNMLPEKEIIDDIEVIRKGTLYTASLMIMKEYISHQRKWADIVIENMLSYPLFIPIYVKKPKLTIVHHLMGISYFNASGLFKGFFGYLGEMIISFIYRKEKFISVSNLTKEDLIKLGISDKSIIVVPNEINCQKYIPANKSNNPLIFFVGGFRDDRKRVEDLIESFFYIEKELPSAELIIAGDGGEKEKKLRRNTKNKNIKFLGYITDKEKIELYQRSWVFVNPSIKEGFGLTIIEANSCGTPAVVYDICGLETIKHGENAIIVDKYDSKRLAKGILYLLKNENIRQEMGVKARLWALKFNSDNMIKRTLDVIENISD